MSVEARRTDENAPLVEMINATIPSLLDPDRIVAEDVTWSVERGQYWAIGGLHGTGKSDFISAAAGILPPIKGTYRLFGQEIAPGFLQELLSTRLRLGLVFDGGRLLGHLTIAENVALPLQYHTDMPLENLLARVRDLLDAVEMSAVAQQLPASVNRNSQQRVGLARALTLKPDVLLLDNPLTGLDPEDARWWLGMLDGLAHGHRLADDKPMTIVATADDLRPWRGHARQFGVLRRKHLRIITMAEYTEEHLMREMVGKDLD
jgi:ABC-type transporter Mla maintaining outer membrane lipid asymmetry ATPase subunit MlaF